MTNNGIKYEILGEIYTKKCTIWTMNAECEQVVRAPSWLGRRHSQDGPSNNYLIPLIALFTTTT